MPIILIIDDEDLALENSLKKEFDCQWYHAYNGDEGIRYAETMTPDLILLDLSFKDQVMQGEDILEELRKINSLNNTPIIMLTHTPAGGHEEKLQYYLGANSFIHKTINLNDIFKHVRRELNEALNRRQH